MFRRGALLSSREPALSFITTQLTQSDGGCGPEEVTGRSCIFQANVPVGFGEATPRERGGKEPARFLIKRSHEILVGSSDFF